MVSRLDRFELTAANCTLIRDAQGNDKVEDYGQVDVFRVRDEVVFSTENGFCITTPTGMKIKSEVGGTDLAEIVSVANTFPGAESSAYTPDEDEDEDEDAEAAEEDGESGEDEEEKYYRLKSDTLSRKRSVFRQIF